MKIENAVVLVTGANRGIGLAFARELLARGARKVYVGARDPAVVTQMGVQALRLDVNKPEDVAAAAALASDVTFSRLAGKTHTGRNVDAYRYPHRVRADRRRNQARSLFPRYRPRRLPFR